jgi:hypothetical protein
MTELTTNAYNVQPGDELLCDGAWIRVEDCGDTSDGQRTWFELAPKHAPNVDYECDSFKIVTVRR